jgi:hypothetical protein
MEDSDSHIKRKEALLLKELDSTLSHVARLDHQIGNFRAWSVAVLVPTLGWCVQSKNLQIQTHSLIYLGAAALIAFYALELRHRAGIWILFEQTDKIKKILNIADQKLYETTLKNHSLQSRPVGKKKIIRLMASSAFLPQVSTWYIFMAFLLAISIKIVRN